MEKDNPIQQEQQHSNSKVASMEFEETDSLLPIHIYQQGIGEREESSKLQTVNEKKQSLVYVETICSSDSIEGENLQRYNYLIEIVREGSGAYTIKQFITQIEEEEEDKGSQYIRDMWRQLREVESVQNVDIPEEEIGIVERLYIRHVQSMQEGMQNGTTIRCPIQYTSPKGQVQCKLALSQSINTPISLQFYQQGISSPLQASPSSKLTPSPTPSNSSFPHEIDILTIKNTPRITPPSLGQNPSPSLNLSQRPISYEFQRELFYSNTPSRIINTIRFIRPKCDQPDEIQQSIQAYLNQITFPPQKEIYPLNIEQVKSEQRLQINTLLAEQKTKAQAVKPKRQKPKLHLNFQYQRRTVPFQEQLKFNIEKDFPKVPQPQMHSLPHYEYKDASSSSYPYNSFSFPQSEFNLPSPSWQYKQNPKQTPRMTYPFVQNQNEPRLSYETPNYSSYQNGYQHINQQRTFPQVAKNVKISLYSPKAPNIFHKQTQSRNRVIKLRSPPRDATYRSKDKTLSPNLPPDFPKNEQNYTQPSNLSPKKQKLRLIQKPKPLQNAQPIAGPQKQIPMFTCKQAKPFLQSKERQRVGQPHRQKIKITLRNGAKVGKTFISDQSAILIQYQQHQIPINLRIN